MYVARHTLSIPAKRGDRAWQLWDSFKNEFKASYYTIQRSGLTKRGQGHQQVAKKKENRDTTICWSAVYSNCSAAGVLKGT